MYVSESELIVHSILVLIIPVTSECNWLGQINYKFSPFLNFLMGDFPLALAKLSIQINGLTVPISRNVEAGSGGEGK